jgi:hypothetical protein
MPESACFLKKINDLRRFFSFFWQALISALECSISTSQVMAFFSLLSLLTLSLDISNLLNMDTQDFGQTWRQLYGEKEVLTERRTNLENELIELRTQITHLDEVLDHLAPLAGMIYASGEDLSALGLTDAIRRVISDATGRISPRDVHQKLASSGYDLSALTAPMASIYKILARLSDSGEIVREKEDGGKVFYKSKPIEISDEDIPF